MSGEIGFRALQNRVLEYARKKGFIKELDELDFDLKTEFLFMIYHHGLVERRQPVEINELIASNRVLFLDWYLFERNYGGTKSIAELYLESQDFRGDFGGVDPKSLREEFRKLKDPIWWPFEVVEKEEMEEYSVKLLDKEDVLLVHDRSSFPRVEVGDFFYGKLYPFMGRWYISGGMTPIPKERIGRHREAESFCRWLEGRFEEFLKDRPGLSERTIGKYEEMFYWFLRFVREKSYTRQGQLQRFNVDVWIKWVRRNCMFLSRTREDEHRAAARRFLEYLLESPAKGTQTMS